MGGPGRKLKIDASGDLKAAMRRVLRLLAKGDRARPMERGLLLDALINDDRSDRPHDPQALVSDAARSATQWLGASAEERAAALCDLLLFTDALGPRPAISLPEKVVELHEALNRADLPHAFGGGLAIAYYGEPRMTKDIDLNVFLPAHGADEIRNVLRPLLAVEQERGSEAELRFKWDENSIHLFLSCDPLHAEMPAHVRAAPFADAVIPVVAPEHLVIRKAILDRPKDWIDVEQILVATDPLDIEEIEAWLERMVGEDDPRMDKLREVKSGLSLD